jgi:hypothetical protein
LRVFDALWAPDECFGFSQSDALMLPIHRRNGTVTFFIAAVIAGLVLIAIVAAVAILVARHRRAKDLRPNDLRAKRRNDGTIPSDGLGRLAVSVFGSLS